MFSSSDKSGDKLTNMDDQVTFDVSRYGAHSGFRFLIDVFG